MIQEIEFDSVEFEGADGKIHMVRQCSLADREELRHRLNQLSQHLKESPIGATIGDLYDQDKMFRHRVNRALQLCGVKPKWVGVDHMIALLFFRKDEEGNNARGWLAELNFPTPKNPTPSKVDPQTYAQIVAALGSYVDGMDRAIALAKSHPWGELLAIVKAKAELQDKQRRMTDKAYAQECEKRESQARAQDALRAIQRKLYGDMDHG